MTLLDERVSAAPLHRPPDRSAAAHGALRAVLIALPFAALAELLLMRTFYRVGVFIPKEGSFRSVYAWLTDAGSFAFNLASVLAIVALALLGVAAFRRRARGLGVAVVAFLVSVLLARPAGAAAVGPAPRLTFALVLIAVVVPFLRSGADAAHRLLVAAIAACFLLSAYGGIAQGPGVVRALGVPGAEIAAELLVVLAAVAAPVAWSRTDRFRPGPVAVAAPLAGAFLAAWTANGSVTGILALWTLGLRLYLAPWVYAIALWAFLTAGIGWLRSQPARSAGMVLLLTAGVLLGSTYQQALALVAVVLLTDGLAFGGLPALASRGERGPAHEVEIGP
jgi:hypothetical protein